MNNSKIKFETKIEESIRKREREREREIIIIVHCLTYDNMTKQFQFDQKNPKTQYIYTDYKNDITM